MKTTLLVLSIALLLSLSTPLVWGDSLNDTGEYSVGTSTISGVAQVLGTNGGNGGPILTFTTGTLQSGTLMNGMFAAGGTFDLIEYGCAGCKMHPRTFLTGSFIGPTSISTNPQGVETLSGNIGGTLFSGQSTTTGMTVQTLSRGGMTGSIAVLYDGPLTAPEPSSLPLLVTGLLAIAEPVRRRFARVN